MQKHRPILEDFLFFFLNCAVVDVRANWFTISFWFKTVAKTCTLIKYWRGACKRDYHFITVLRFPFYLCFYSSDHMQPRWLQGAQRMFPIRVSTCILSSAGFVWRQTVCCHVSAALWPREATREIVSQVKGDFQGLFLKVAAAHIFRSDQMSMILCCWENKL